MMCDQLSMVQHEAVQHSLYPQHHQAAAVAGLPHAVNVHDMRRLSTLQAHAASSSGHEEGIPMERILYNFDDSDNLCENLFIMLQRSIIANKQLCLDHTRFLINSR
jgi:hypothetical protein